MSTGSFPAQRVCSPCHPECSICDGPTTSDCQACTNAFQSSDGSTIDQCLSSCPDNSNQCLTCDSQCNGCRGATNRDCISCKESNVTDTQTQQTVCIAQCGVGQYLNTSLFSCQPCDSRCISCTGPRNSQCQQCRGPGASVGGEMTCLSSCPVGMYISSSGTCMDCDEQCGLGGCYGPTNGDCNECANNEVQSENATMCVAACPFAQTFDIDANSCKLSK